VEDFLNVRAVIWVTVASLTIAAKSVFAVDAVDYATQIQPIFQKNCYSCHGPDARKGGLRLSDAKGALLGGDSGKPALVAGKSTESQLIQLVESADETKRMPLNKPALSAEEIALLKSWIDGGASWGDATHVAPVVETNHWAFKKPVQPAPPAATNAAFARSPIDAFVLARLEMQGLSPSPEADRRALIRRVSLDLIGLPPTPEEVEAFVNDAAPDAYERLVDRLLASPHYGEKMAIAWLDAARYADSNGYEKDRWRSIWPYRDWVIKAFNADMPYNEFVIEQIAGDLLPNATLDQRVATGFHCNTMLNEEGGVDVEEFRFEAMVDRTSTTAAVMLGLTMACAQCHTHKFDPITQREYYQFQAFLDNTDDLILPLPDEKVTIERQKIETNIAKLESELESKFPEADPIVQWLAAPPTTSSSASGAILSADSDFAITVSNSQADKDVYTLTYDVSDPITVSGLRIEALASNTAPGLSERGNFVLSEVRTRFEPNDGSATTKLKFARAEADHSQSGYEIEKAIDGKGDTGWAIDGAPDGINHTRTATFWLKEPLQISAPGKAIIELEQSHGARHILGRFRVSAGIPTIPESSVPAEQRRRDHFNQKYAKWLDDMETKAVHWTLAQPLECVSKFHATFRRLPDGSFLAVGDIPNTDTYDATFRTDLKGITGIRIEVLPDPSLPGGGPGRGVIMAEGDFLLSELSATAAPWTASDAFQPITLQDPTHSFAADGRGAPMTLDGKMDTGWGIKGREGQAHEIVYQFAQPVGFDGGTQLALKIEQYYVHQQTIGRFRVSVTTDPLPVRACGAPANVEAALSVPRGDRNVHQSALIKKFYLSIAPELDSQHEEIEKLRASMPKYPTTLVLQERDDVRTTRIHHRGEFLSPREAVTPAVPAIMPPLPENAPLNRLAFAKWLVSEDQPLTSRVMVNRLWMACFGRGIVNTPEDFGLRSEAPSHPELLDWLAVEFMRRGWSMKEMMRMIVTSATYRQSSRVSKELLAADPTNEWYARGPRFRVDAEIVRDLALSAGGLLNPAIGGPSAYPPLPDGTLALVFPGQGWFTSTGADQYRRGIYTAWKRTIPYPTSTVFDSPARDTACVRRARSNTPLQSLTVLNDAMFMDAARAMAKRVAKEAGTNTEDRIRRAFMVCVSRPPDDAEMKSIQAFFQRQNERFAANPDGAKTVALGQSEARVDADTPALAAWTMVCRVLLNLDETITKG
jgi:mono/diheme cytochrome c family protein